MQRRITTLASVLSAAAVIGMSSLPAQAAPLSGAGLTAGMTSLQAEKIHGRHCGFQRGHRHLGACRTVRYQDQSSYYDYRKGDEVTEGQYRNSSYSNYPFWANKAFTDADDRGGRGGRR